jgi:hypothetical protein
MLNGQKNVQYIKHKVERKQIKLIISLFFDFKKS